MNSSPSDRDPVEVLAEEFLARRRRGERPSVEEYAGLHPALADQIRAVLPAMALVEDFGAATATEAGPPPGPSPSTAGGTGRRIGEYRIVREVGRGGMGVVYEAEQVALGRRVALKLLPPRGRDDARYRARFEREARAAGRLHHTNIVPVFGVGEHEGTPYYAMQFIDGWGLDEVVRGVWHRPGGEGAGLDVDRQFDGPTPTREQTAGWPPALGDPPPPTEPAGGTAPPARSRGDAAAGPGRIGGPRQIEYWRGVARVGAQVADALAYAHAQGVVHRDIKPSNILLDARGTAWVADFGLARSDDASTLTETGDVLGTLRYMPPESFEGRAGAPGDVYGLGLTLYELVALRPAFGQADRGRLIRAVTEGGPPRIRTVAPQVPRDLETIIHKAIERDPSDRYATASALAEDLRRFLEDRPVRARRAGELERLARWGRRNPAMSCLAASLLAILVLTTVVSLRVAARFRDQAEVQRGLASQNALERSKAERALREAEQARLEAERARLEEVGARKRAVAEADRASFNEARGLRLGHQPGWRGRSLEILSRLAGRPEPVLDPLDLRTEAVAGLAGVDIEEVARLYGDPGEVRALAFSPEGDTLATVGRGGTLRAWDLRAGRELRRVDASVEPAWSPAPRLHYRPRGGPVAFLTQGRGLRWLGTAPPPPLAHPERVRAFQLDGPGRRMVAVGEDRRARVYDLPSGRLLLDLESRGDEVALAPDGSRLATIGPDGSLRLTDVAGGGTRVLERPAAAITQLAFSRDGSLVSAGDVEGMVRIWGVDPPRAWTALRAHRTPVHALEFSPDGLWLATGGHDMTVRIWEARSGGLLGTLQPGSRELPDLAFSPDGDLLAVATADGYTALYAVRGRASLRRYETTQHRLAGVAFDPARPRLYAAGLFGRVSTLDLDSGREIPARGLDAGSPWKLAVSPDGAWLLAGQTGGGPPRLCPLTSGGPARLLEGHGARASVEAVAFDPAGRYAASGGADGSVVIWRLDDPRPAWSLDRGVPDWVESIGFLPGGEEVLVGSRSRGLVAFEARTKRQTRAVAVPDGGVDSFAIGPAGGRVWVATYGRTIRSYRLPGLEEDASAPRAFTEQVRAMAASPGGTLLAIADGQGAIAVHDARTGRPLFAMPTTTRWVQQLDFDPSSRLLAVAGNDADVAVWDLGRIVSGLSGMGLDTGVPTDQGGPEADPIRPTEARAIRAADLREGDAGRADREIRALEEAATAALEARDPQGYRGACAAALGRSGGLGDPRLLGRLARLCALGPGAMVDPTAPVRLAEQAAAEVEPERAGDALCTLGAALGRAGHFADSIRELEAGIARRGGRAGPDDRSFLALAWAGLGRPDRARRELIVDGPRPIAASDRLAARQARLLRLEAEAAAWDGGFPRDPFGR